MAVISGRPAARDNRIPSLTLPRAFDIIFPSDFSAIKLETTPYSL
jgi:hypothetical protein